MYAGLILLLFHIVFYRRYIYFLVNEKKNVCDKSSTEFLFFGKYIKY